MVFNIVCGCAAGTAHPGVLESLNGEGKRLLELLTVFAGHEAEGVANVRKFTLPFLLSTPSIALFKNGELVHFIERHNIEGRSAAMIAENLK